MRNLLAHLLDHRANLRPLCIPHLDQHHVQGLGHDQGQENINTSPGLVVADTTQDHDHAATDVVTRVHVHEATTAAADHQDMIVMNTMIVIHVMTTSEVVVDHHFQVDVAILVIGRTLNRVDVLECLVSVCIHRNVIYVRYLNDTVPLMKCR